MNDSVGPMGVYPMTREEELEEMRDEVSSWRTDCGGSYCGERSCLTCSPPEEAPDEEEAK